MIVHGVNNKNVKDWESLYKLFYAPLCAYSRNKVQDAAAAEDVVQDTLIKIWCSKKVFSDMRDLTLYLYRAVYNNSLYWLRTKKIHDNILQTFEPVQSDWDDNQFAMSVKEEIIRRLYVFIEQLPPKRKQIIMMSIDGMSGAEITQKLNISINTVKVQKSQALKFLRTKMEKNPLLFLL